MKRVVLVVGLCLGFAWGSAAADTVGAKRMARANRRCERMAAHYARGGFTPYELGRLAHEPCKVDRSGHWSSAKVWTQ